MGHVCFRGEVQVLGLCAQRPMLIMTSKNKLCHIKSPQFSGIISREAQNDEDFTDVTLAVLDDHEERVKLTPAHKFILASSSRFFKDVLKGLKGQSRPVLFLHGIDLEELNELLQFIYAGEIIMDQMRMKKFLSICNTFGICGLNVTDDEGVKVDDYQQLEGVKADDYQQMVGFTDPLGENDDLKASKYDPEDNKEVIDTKLYEENIDDLEVKYDDDDKERLSPEGLRLPNIRSKYTQISAWEYECSKCRKIIRAAPGICGNLRNHYKYRHMKVPIAKCGICGKVLKHDRALKSHMKMYHGEGMKTMTSFMDKYRVINEGQREYECLRCGKVIKAAFPYVLKDHYEFAHEGVKCKVCGMKINNMAELADHKYNFHK